MIRREKQELIDKTGILTFEKRLVVYCECDVCRYREDQHGQPL